MHRAFEKTKDILISFLGLILVIIIFGIATRGQIFSPFNLQTILNQSYSLAVLSIGVTFIFAHGGIDFSCASVMAFSAMLSGMLINAGLPVLLGAVVSILAAVLCSAVTGLLTVTFGVPAFISSLCMMNIARGIVMAVISTNSIRLTMNLSLYKSWGVKLGMLVLLLAIGGILLNKSLMGHYNKAIGENPTAAAQSGIHVKKYRLLAYIFSGICVGIAAFFLLCRSGMVTTGFANGLQLEVIVALLLGGLPPKGGYRCRIRSSLIGSLILGILGNGLVVLGINDLLIEGVQGIVFLAVIYINYAGSSHFARLGNSLFKRGTIGETH